MSGVINFKQRSKNALGCKQCAKEADEKEKRLKKLLSTSQRAGCKCGRKMQHKDSCPMHLRFFGDVPFLGCDVTTREEADWLAERKRKAR